MSKSQIRRQIIQGGTEGKKLSDRIKDDDFWHVEEVEALENAQSQEANAILCNCAFEEEMMGKVPEGSFCPFCMRRRYESVIVFKRDALKEIGILRQIQSFWERGHTDQGEYEELVAQLSTL